MTLPEYGEKKTWQFWGVWEGYKISEIEFDDSELIEGEDISYKEYRDRLVSATRKCS